eukprot:COSAG02_NODE_1123_length_14441_cov_28.984521_1_plen_87_part_00
MAHAWLILYLLVASSTSAPASAVTVRSGDGSLSLSFEGAAITATSLGGVTTNSQSAFSLTEFSSTYSDEWCSWLMIIFALEACTVF